MRAWDGVVRNLSQTARCISLDLPAHGQTLIEPLKFPELGDAIFELCKKISVLQPFLIGQFPVTNAEYARFLNASPGVMNPSDWTRLRPRQPVVGVTWDEARQFCEWLRAFAVVAEKVWMGC